LIAYFIGNISAKKYQNPFMCIKVIASQRWDVFLRHGVVSDIENSNKNYLNKPTFDSYVQVLINGTTKCHCLWT